MQEKEMLTEIFAKADILFGMRKMLTKYGVPSNEPLKISFKLGNREIETEIFPAISSKFEITEVADEADLKEAVKDFLHKVDVMYHLTEKLNIPQGKDSFEIIFKSGQGFSTEKSLLFGKCCPCPNQPVPCCVC